LKAWRNALFKFVTWLYFTAGIFIPAFLWPVRREGGKEEVYDFPSSRQK